jgi:hypothetical protein
MKKYIVWVMCLFALLPNTLFAYTSFQENEVYIENSINENVYLAGEKVVVSGNLSEDLFAGAWDLTLRGNIQKNTIVAGGNIEVTGSVAEDLMFAGWTVEVRNTIGGDIRGIGFDITLEKSVTGDVAIAWGDITLNREVLIYGDLWLFATHVNMRGLVKWKTNITAESLNLDGILSTDAFLQLNEAKDLNLGPNAKIMGKLTYKAAERIPALEKIAIGWAVYEGISEFSSASADAESLGGLIDTSVTMGSLVVISLGGILLLYLFPNFTRKTAEIVKESPGKSFLFGLLYIILTPIIAIVLLITIVGIPLGLLAIVIYVYTIGFAKLITLVIASQWVNITWKESLSGPWKKWVVFAILALVLTFSSGIDLLLALFAYGAVILLIVRKYQK